MNIMVKSQEKQIELMDHIILPLYGFRNIRDYDFA